MTNLSTHNVTRVSCNQLDRFSGFSFHLLPLTTSTETRLCGERLERSSSALFLPLDPSRSVLWPLVFCLRKKLRHFPPKLNYFDFLWLQLTYCHYSEQVKRWISLILFAMNGRQNSFLSPQIQEKIPCYIKRNIRFLKGYLRLFTMVSDRRLLVQSNLDYPDSSEPR